MMFVKVVPCGVVVEFDATDCIQLTDALHYAREHDIHGNLPHLEAMCAALEACTIVAAHDTIVDNKVLEEEFFADARRVWGPRDTRWLAGERVLEPPK